MTNLIKFGDDDGETPQYLDEEFFRTLVIYAFEIYSELLPHLPEHKILRLIKELRHLNSISKYSLPIDIREYPNGDIWVEAYNYSIKTFEMIEYKYVAPSEREFVGSYAGPHIAEIGMKVGQSRVILILSLLQIFDKYNNLLK